MRSACRALQRARRAGMPGSGERSGGRDEDATEWRCDDDKRTNLAVCDDDDRRRAVGNGAWSEARQTRRAVRMTRVGVPQDSWQGIGHAGDISAPEPHHPAHLYWPRSICSAAILWPAKTAHWPPRQSHDLALCPCPGTPCHTRARRRAGSARRICHTCHGCARGGVGMCAVEGRGFRSRLVQLFWGYRALALQLFFCHLCAHVCHVLR